MTQQARDGGIDPVFGRDREIRQVIDVVAAAQQPDPGRRGGRRQDGRGRGAGAPDRPGRRAGQPEGGRDRGARPRSLQAGAGVKGEFEARMKAVIDAVRAPKPTILFIDEAHTLVGGRRGRDRRRGQPFEAGPRARRARRRPGASTKAHREGPRARPPLPDGQGRRARRRDGRRDDARDQDRYEDHHAVQITDDRRAAVELGHLGPSVDLIDTASARVRMSQDATPAALDDSTPATRSRPSSRRGAATSPPGSATRAWTS